MIRPMIRLALLSVFLFLTMNSSAQKVTIFDISSKKAIENVYIFNSKNSVLSDASGEANLSGFSKSEIIYFQHPAYKNIELSFDDITKLSFNIQLQSDIFPINEILISANKWEQKRSEIPLKIAHISKEIISHSTAQTSADLLKESNQVYIQKSQLGGGSPMIRGFSANRVLLVLDGIRLNNAIYRSGNLQNVINIDPNSLESAEVILGPGSIIYGSDAIGGVMDFHTINPLLSTSKKANVKFNYKSRYSSANKEIMNHANYNFGKAKLAFAGSVSYSDFSDLKMGSDGPDDYLRPEYASRQNGKDKIVKNTDSRKQINSAYSQLNLLQKIRFKASNNLDFLYNFQLSETSNIPRYDRLIQYSDENLKYAEWYYGPQNLQLHGFQIKNSKSNLFYDSFKVISAYQNYKESRYSRSFNSSSLKARTENLNIYSVNADAEKQINKSFHFYYGSEWTYNKLKSKGNSTNILTDEKSAIASRYPNNSSYSSFAIYSNLKWKLDPKWTLNTGIRYSHVWIKSKLDDTFYNFPFENLDLSTGSINGGIGVSHQSDKGWLLKLNATSGFRAPNIDDIGKVFDSEPGKVIVPNKNLKPEYVYNFEFNLSKTFNNILFLDLNAFYSFLDNAMIRQDFSFNGQSTMIYDGVESDIQAIVNTDNARVWGGNISAILKLTDQFSVKSNLNITKGEYKDGSPVRHVPPIFGNFSLNYKSNRLRSQLIFEFNDEISYNNLADTEKDKDYLYAKNEKGLPYTPSWAIVSLKNTITISKRFSTNISLENILNKRYRPYSSGISAAGRNFVLGISYKI